MNLCCCCCCRPFGLVRVLWAAWWIAVAAAVVARPFELLWHPLGVVLAVALFVPAWLGWLIHDHRRRRAGCQVHAEAWVRR